MINNVTVKTDWAKGNWAIPALRYPSTGCSLFTNFQIFQGYYTKSNISSAVPLQTINPEGPYPQCPNPLLSLSPEEYSVLNQTTATVGFHFKHNKDYSRLGTIVNGIYSQSGQVVHYVLFPKGVYTVAAGDLWGQMVILHFSVE